MSPEIVVKEILSTVANVLPKLIELFSHVGGKDAFLTAVDSTLAVARAKTDADLARKHASVR
jgi:hypothetical protein